ncbi:coatomer beta subunit appendage platform-domain-containing protein [Suillus ampliporus]|nr:coatomer beta subunit appendage platform-domain-containing protein [Suillus ampliporus]
MMRTGSSSRRCEVVLFLKKQLQRTQEREFEKAPEYRQLLIQSIHVLAVKFSEVAASIVHALMEFLEDSNNPSALDIVAFVREVVEKFPHLRPSICDKLTQTLTEIKSGKAFRGILWILSEYVDGLSDIESTFQEIRKVLGEIPILASEQRLLDDAEGEEDKRRIKRSRGVGGQRCLPTERMRRRRRIQSASSARLEAVKAASKLPLGALILGGDFFTCAVLAATLTKLALQFEDLTDDRPKANALRAESMLIMTSIIRVGQSKFVTPQEKTIVHDTFLKDTKVVYSKMLVAQEKKAAEKKELESTQERVVQVDDLLTFRQFSKNSADDLIDYVEDLGKATGVAEVWEDFISNVTRISQLTEVYIKMHGFDILLGSYTFLYALFYQQRLIDGTQMCFWSTRRLTCCRIFVLIFATLGDLKLVERPAVYTIAPHCFQSIKATIKVSSTETGVILGSILWEGPALAERCVILNDIPIDIMDYIKPAYCMWIEFEWANRVNVSTNMSDPRNYLKHVMKSTNMSCLTPEGAMSGDCDFLSANMYARSLFDAFSSISQRQRRSYIARTQTRMR